MPSPLLRTALILAIPLAVLAEPGMAQGVAAQPKTELTSSDDAHQAAPRTSESTLFDLISAGIAHHRKDPAYAASSYLTAARREADPEIARLAWQASLGTRDPKRLMEAARCWANLDPSSEMAQQTLLADAIEKRDEKRLSEGLAALDAAHRKKTEGQKDSPEGAWIPRISRLFAQSRPSDAELFAKAIAPYVAKHPTPENRLAEAQLLKAAGRTLDACGKARAAQKKRSADAEFTAEAANICWSGDRKAALRILETFLRKHPKEAEVRLVYARALQRLGRTKEALAAADRAARNAGDNDAVLYNAGQIAAECGDAVRAEKHFLAYTEQVGKNEDTNLSHNDAWLHLGNAAMMQKAPERAVGYWHRLAAGPNAVEARIREAMTTAAELGRREDALRILREGREALRRGPTAPLYSAEAGLLIEAGRMSEAFTLLEEAAKIHSEDPGILYDAAMAAEATGHNAESEAYLRRLLQADPEHIDGMNALGYLLAKENRRLAEARDLLEKAFAAEPLNPYILDSMGWLNYREGRLRAALEFTRSSLNRTWDAEVAEHLVAILCALEEREEAQRTLDELAARATVTPDVRATAERCGLRLPDVKESEP